jgi:hypothetical protein
MSKASELIERLKAEFQSHTGSIQRHGCRQVDRDGRECGKPAVAQRRELPDSDRYFAVCEPHRKKYDDVDFERERAVGNCVPYRP